MNIMLDDTHGYFVIGGGKFIQGTEGYYGPTTFYRIQGLPADQVEYNIFFMFLYYIKIILSKVTYNAFTVYNFNS